MHDILTGKSVPGILYFLNKTPVDGFSRKQSTVETSTYGSEFVAAKLAVQQIVNLRLMLRYLGVPVAGKAFMFGDNESVVKSGSMPHSKLKKRQNALSYHFVREAIAAGLVGLTHIPGECDPADILNKHWGYSNVWPMLKPLLFFEGDTSKIFEEDARKIDQKQAPKSG